MSSENEEPRVIVEEQPTEIEEPQLTTEEQLARMQEIRSKETVKRASQSEELRLEEQLAHILQSEALLITGFGTIVLAVTTVSAALLITLLTAKYLQAALLQLIPVAASSQAGKAKKSYKNQKSHQSLKIN